MRLIGAKLTGRISLWGNMNQSTPVFKFSIGSLKTHFKDANYRKLAKTLKFSTTKDAMCT